MNSLKSDFFRTIFATFIIFNALSIHSQKIYTTYLWHMDQPVYWADKSKDKPESKQFAEESHRLKMSGQNMYPGSAIAHPTNNLEDIFSKADRVNAYQYTPKTAIQSISSYPDAGAQLSISAGLLENIQSLGAKNQWGYSAGWMNAYNDAYGWKTWDGFPKLDIVNFTYDHALSPLISERTLKKQILAHKYVAHKYYGSTSKGYWPAEGAFSERIIKVLAECGIEWSIIANSHLARTLSDYVHPYNINGNIEAPNKADVVETTGVNWFDATIDGRGSRLAVPYSYQAHKAQYVDPKNGQIYKIDVVPMCNYLSYVDGYSGVSAGEVAQKIEPFSTMEHPSMVLLAHDGDNAWGGGSSYYNEAVSGFTNGAAAAGYKPTTIQQFLKDNPVPAADIVHVEDGAWVNAENDWGHPQFINWLWPLYSTSNYRFNPNGWTEDARNWAVITATENYVTMAEDLEGGNLRIDYISDGGSAATNSEKAWHFYFGGLNSGFMYYGKAEDMEVKPSMTGNIAIEYAQKVIDANAGTDNTAPSVFIPQRFPYNPGEAGFSPYTGYKKVSYSSDFHIWTFAYDVSGLTSVILKYRIDLDGKNPISSTQNDTYAGGSEVEPWQNIEMTRQPMAADPTDPELNFFILPKAKADLCYAEIAGIKDKLVDYYVEATDTKGNIFKTPIQHVYIGTGEGQLPADANVSWTPAKPSSQETITITCKNATAASKLHWGVNSWDAPDATYRPEGTIAVSGKAVETPFRLTEGKWQVVLGPFNNPAQAVTAVNFVIKHESGWDNNGGSDYLISVSATQTSNPTGTNITQNLDQNSSYTFAQSDFNFASSVGNSFKGIRILSLPAAGALTVHGLNAAVNQLITDVSLLKFTAAVSSASFTFKIVDNANLESDAVYTATFTVYDPTQQAITVSFKKPADWGTIPVYMWAWTDSGNLFPAWPGIAITDTGNGWYSYTFEKSITSINVIFSKNGSPQSANIMGVTQSTCFETDNPTGNFTVKEVSCSTTGLWNKPVAQSIAIYPQPVKSEFYLNLPNTGYCEEYELHIVDLNGKTVKQACFTGQMAQINCENLVGGVYVVRIVNDRKNEIYTSRLVKL